MPTLRAKMSNKVVGVSLQVLRGLLGLSGLVSQIRGAPGKGDEEYREQLVETISSAHGTAD